MGKPVARVLCGGGVLFKNAMDRVGGRAIDHDLREVGFSKSFAHTYPVWLDPEMLDAEFRREREGKIQVFTRQSVLMRLITHDASHAGEISQTLGMHGFKDLDLWTGRVARQM